MVQGDKSVYFYNVGLREIKTRAPENQKLNVLKGGKGCRKAGGRVQRGTLLFQKCAQACSLGMNKPLLPLFLLSAPLGRIVTLAHVLLD